YTLTFRRAVKDSSFAGFYFLRLFFFSARSAVSLPPARPFPSRSFQPYNRRMDNKTIARILRDTAQLLEIDGAIIGRYRSYEKAAELISGMHESIEELA